MHRLIKTSMVYFLVASLLLVPMAGTVLAEEIYKEEISSEKMAADLVLVRPVGLVSMIAGTVLFVFSLPFSFSEANMEQNREEIGENITKFIVEPSKYTFNRRLGDM